MSDEQKSQQHDGFLTDLGVKITRASADDVLLTLEVSKRHLQPFGILHGGVHCALIESAASIGAWYAAGNEPVVGVEHQTSFLKPTREGATLSALATPIAVGRRTQLWQVAVTDENDKLMASGRVRLMTLS